MPYLTADDSGRYGGLPRKRNALKEAHHREPLPRWVEFIGDSLTEILNPYGPIESGRQTVEDLKAGSYGPALLAAGGVLPGVIGATMRRGRAAKRTLNESQRLARATEQGYLLDEPMYHGSNALFEVFDPARRGASTNRMSAKAADWAHSSRDAAYDFADLAAGVGGKRVVRKLVPNKEGFATLNLKGADISDLDMANFLLERKAEGVRVVKIDGVNDSVGKAHPGPVYAILDQGAVRDVDAARFDPAELGRPGLTKALAGLGLSIPLVRSLQTEPQEPKI